MDIHYRPPWYPNKNPEHNPWTITDPISGLTNYGAWVKSLPEGKLEELIREHLEELIREHREGGWGG